MRINYKKEVRVFFFSFLFTCLTVLGFFFLRLPASAATGIYRTINFQGKVVNKTDSTNVTNGSYTFVFKLYDADTGGGTQLPSGTPWSESQSITVTNGVFRATIGSVTPIPTGIDFNSDTLWLDVTFNGETFGSRVRLTAVPYAFNAEKVSGLTVTNTTGTLTIANAKTVSFADAFTTSGAFPLTLTTTASTNLTLPTTGTLATLAGTEEFTNKTIGSTGLVFSGATTDITTASNENLVISPNGSGKVGILNTNPLEALDVTGNASFSGNVTVGYGSSYRSAYGPLRLAYKSGLNTWTTGVYLQDTTGNVGIGTTDPGYSLHVNGDMQVENRLYLNGLNALTFNSTSGFESGYIHGEYGTLSMQSIVNGGIIFLNSSNAQYFTFDNDSSKFGFGLNNSSPTEMIDVLGNATASGNITMGGQLQVGRFGYDPTSLGNGSMVYNTSTNKFRCYQNGAWTDCVTPVGGAVWSSITAPTTNLSMNMYQSVGTSFATTFTYGNATSTTNLFNITDTASNTGTGYMFNLTTQASSALKPFHVSSAGVEAIVVDAAGNVGIGNASPATKLDVVQAAAASTAEEIAHFAISDDANAYMSIRNGSTTDSLFSPQLRFKGSGSNTAGNIQALITTDTGSSPAWIFTGQLASSALTTRPLLAIRNYTTDVMNILANGNLGINSTSPAERLDVGGNATASGNITMGGQLQVGQFGYDPIAFGNGSISYNTSTNKFRCYQNGAWTDCIGAGSGTPGGLDTYVQFNDGSTFGGDAGFTYNKTTDRLTLGSLTVDTNTLYVDDVTNRVAIGSTTANEALDVTGNATVSGYLTVGQTGGIRSQYGPLNFQYKSNQNAWTTGMVLQDSTGFLGLGNVNPTANLDITSSQTTGNAMNLTANSLTSGNGMYLSSTATALTGDLLSLYLNPASASTITGDVLGINSGPNLTLSGYYLNITNNGSAVFQVGQNQIVSAVPHAFTASGDVSMAYDLIFTNPTTSFIKSDAPFTIENGPVWGSNNLTLRTFNAGSIIADTATFRALYDLNVANYATVGGSLAIGYTSTPSSPVQTLDVVGSATVSANMMLGGQLMLGRFAYAPTALGAGSMYYDSVAAKVYFHNGSAWTEMGAGSVASSSVFQEISGTIRPMNNTVDFLFGGTATTSAKFAFLNVNNGAPMFRLDSDNDDTNKGCLRYNGSTNQMEYSNDCTTFQSFASSTGGGWTDDGTVVRLTTGTDNVGIGNASPTQKLDVTGNATVSGNITIGGQLQVGRFGYDPIAFGNGSISYNTTTNKFRCYQNGAWTDCIGTGGSGTPGGLDTYVQFNDGGSTFGGDAGFTYNKTTDRLTVGALSVGGGTAEALDITGNATVSGNITAGGQVLLGRFGYDPTALADGAMYYNTTSNTFRCSIGGAWKDCAAGTREVYVMKGSNEGVTNSTALQDDNELFFSVASGEQWYYNFDITFTTNSVATNDIRVGVNSSAATTTCTYGFESLSHAGNVANGNATACNTALVIATTATGTKHVIVAGTVRGMTGSGTVVFRWAQGTLDATNATTVVAGSSLHAFKISGADLGELYTSKNGSLEPGTVVSLDPTRVAGVQPSLSAYDSTVIGVISTKPGLVIGDATQMDGGTPVVVALSGRIPVRVSTESGAIRAGDYLTASSVPGVAMKATKPGTVIGQALVDYSPGLDGKVLAFIKNGFYNGSTQEIYSANVQNSISTLQNLVTQKTSQVDGSTISQLTGDRIIGGLEVVSPQVTTRSLLTQDIHSMNNSISVKFTEDGEMRIDNDDVSSSAYIRFDTEGNGYFTGTLMAEHMQSSEITNLLERLTTLENKLFEASQSSLLNYDQLIPSSTQAAILEGLTVARNATIGGKLHVVGSGLVEGVLNVIDTVTSSNVIVSNWFNAMGKAIFHDSVTFMGRPTFNKDTGGFVTVKKGTDHVEVLFENAYDVLPVVNVSMISDKQNLQDAFSTSTRYVIGKRTAKGFTIQLDRVADDDVVFSWTALSISNSGEVSGVTTAQ